MAAIQAWRLTRFTDYAAGQPIPAAMSLPDRLMYAVTSGISPRSRNKEKPDFPYTGFRVTTPDGIRLAGWKSDAPTGTTSTVIICHGHGASKSAVLPEARTFRNLGFRVVLFDFRAHGESTGNVCSVGYYEAADVKAIWDKVRREYPDNKITLYGISMGAVASARATAIYHLKPEALILDMPYNRLIDAVRSRVRLMGVPSEPLASLLTFWGGVELGFSGFGNSTADYVTQISCPVMLQWGEADNRVSRDEITAIKASGRAGKLPLNIYKKLGHVSLCKNAPSLWKQNLLRFLEQPVLLNQ